MLVNADFSRRVIVTPQQYDWVASPQPGVERVMLDRIGGEQARATSIVRYAPGARFPGHRHPGGEEILVLSGVLSENGADHPAGCYLRNPPGSAHAPSSMQGALLFVKLGQMPPAERRSVRIDTGAPAAWHTEGGHQCCPLFDSEHEQASLRRLSAGQALPLDAGGRTDILIVSGALALDRQSYGHGSWMRLPAGQAAILTAGAHGAMLYLKTSRDVPAGAPA